ncbi:hypothetical protein Pan2_61 [Pseudanabaena phage Pan2]|nr:hypothetical protein Pan2_61 [Pseudanabaena phage Pan2]
MTDDVKALIAEARVRGRKEWVEANPDLAGGLIRNLGAVLEAASVAPAVDREALAETIRQVASRGQYQMPDDSVPYEQWSLGMADAVMDVLGARDVRDVQAEALEEAADATKTFRHGAPYEVWAWCSDWLRARAQAIREARNA